MEIFGDKKGKAIEKLETENQKLWVRINEYDKLFKELQKEIAKKTSDHEKDAFQSSRKAAEYRNKTLNRLEEVEEFLNNIQTTVDSAEVLKNSIQLKNDEAIAKSEEINEIKNRLDLAETEQRAIFLEQQERIKKLDEFFEEYPNLEADLSQVDESIRKIEENRDKSSVSLTAINNRKKAIDEIHREIFGYTETDENGIANKIDGLKDEINRNFTDLSTNIEDALETVDSVNKKYSDKYKEFEGEHRNKYETIRKEIQSLLPDALTAGLSAAFSKKKEDEVLSSTSLQNSFSLGIAMLIVVSLVPVVISCIFLYQEIPLVEVINRLPRLVLAIVPMYVPVMWFTYSASKKLNLSKRLIEEYAHKEVISKTYEGLTKQISGISDPEQSAELKFKLLSNFLQVSSENPGKLISNYEVSDHPIMEALEQSYKLQIAIDKLEGVPGMGKVAAFLEAKSKKKVADKKEKIESILDDEVKMN